MAKTRAGAWMMGVRGTALDELLGGLREQREKEEWGCRKMYPPGGKRGPVTKVQLRVRADRSNSPLRHELRPEDIEEVQEVDWKELMKEFDKPVVEGEIDGGTFLDFFDDRYGLYVIGMPFPRSMHSADTRRVLAGDRTSHSLMSTPTIQVIKTRTWKPRTNL